MSRKIIIQGRLTVYEVDPMLQQRVDPVLRGTLLEMALARGRARLVVQTSNLFVDQGLDILVGLLAGGEGVPPFGGMAPGNVLTYTVAKMKVATGAVAAPAAGDVAMAGVLQWTAHRDPVAASLLTVVYGATGVLTFSTTIPNINLNGLTLTEEALFDANDNMMARVVFSKAKLITFGLQLDHEITFTAT